MRKFITLISVAMYLLSLPSEVFRGWNGFGVLLLGWIPNTPANLSWLANPFIF